MTAIKRCGAAALGALLAAASVMPAALAGEVWMTNMQSGNVQVFDADTLEVLATIPAAKGAHNVTFSPDGSRAFVANVDTSSVTVIDADQKVALTTIPAGAKAHDVAVSPDGRIAVAADVGADTIAVIDVAQGMTLGTLATGNPNAMMSMFSGNGRLLYVGNAGSGRVSVVDVAYWRVLGTLPGGLGMMKFIPVEGGRKVWFPAPGEDQLKLLDLTTTGAVIDTLTMPGDPHGMALSPDWKMLYVVQRKLNRLVAIDLASRAERQAVTLEGRPDMIAISPNGASLYVTLRDADKLLMISTIDLGVRKQMSTGVEPHGVAYRPWTP
jgi:YVTN family beta-propeller protein